MVNRVLYRVRHAILLWQQMMRNVPLSPKFAFHASNTYQCIRCVMVYNYLILLCI